MELPSTRQLQAFLAIAETENFSKAAEICGISQPAVSQQIQSLEALLNAKLLERGSHGVRLTDVGQRLQKVAAMFMQQMQSTVEKIHAEAGFLPARVRLGVIPTIAPYVLPAFLPRMSDYYPEATVVVHEGFTQNLVARANAGDLDVLLVAREGDLGSLHFEEFGFEPFSLLTLKDHPIAKKGEKVEEDWLRDEQVLLLDDGHCLRDTTLNLCRNISSDGLGDFRASSLTTLVKLVALGHGVTILPQMAIADEVDSNLVATPFANPEIGRRLGLAWRKSSPFGSHWSELVDLLKGLLDAGFALKKK